MIHKILKKNDPLKEAIEKDKKRLESLPKENIHEQKKRMEQLTNESLPKLIEDIEELILNIKKDALSCTPREILDYFGWFYGTTNSSQILEDIDSLNNASLDYIHSLVTSLDYSFHDNNCSKDCFERIKKNIEALHMQVNFYLMIISIDREKVPDMLKLTQAITHLNVRGDSYTEHKIKMCTELFSKYDEALVQKYGITSKKLIDELIKIANYPSSNMDIQIKYMKEMKKAHKLFIENSKEAQRNNNLEGEWDNIIQGSKKYFNEKFQKINKETNIAFQDSTFKVHEISLPKEVLNQISMEIGENICFKNGKIEYFPMNDSKIYNKPLVRIDDDYYCFNSPLIHYNLHLLLENIVLNIIPEKKHQPRYYKKKGEYLEDKSLELFQKLLPNSKIYKNLKYGEDYEVDGLVIYDNNIFIIEAKSNKLTLGAKKGNTDKIKRNTKDIIEKAYTQAIRVKKYITSNKNVEFRDKKTKKTVLKIENNKVNNIYLINTTLESLGHITANLNSLKQFGFIQGKDWIWSVYLNDLQIISEIIESPSEFLLYLERRIKLNDTPQIHSMEEIDIFGYFLHDGLYFDGIDFPEQNYMMLVTGYSKEIDEYYHWKEGHLEEPREKPSFMKKSPIKNIIKQIEDTNKDKFSLLSKFLLSYDGQQQIEIKNNVLNILQKIKEDFSMFSDIENLGFTFISKQSYGYNRAYNLSQIYCYERRINNWFVVIIDNDFIDFEYFRHENNENEIIEKKLEDLKEYRLKQALEINKKIGRNETCPCGSGKKYKICCLKNG